MHFVHATLHCIVILLWLVIFPLLIIFSLLVSLCLYRTNTNSGELFSLLVPFLVVGYSLHRGAMVISLVWASLVNYWEGTRQSHFNVYPSHAGCGSIRCWLTRTVYLKHKTMLTCSSFIHSVYGLSSARWLILWLSLFFLIDVA